MKQIRKSLFAKIFTAVAATAILVVLVMALMVAILMRDGFAHYLLKGELARFDDMVVSLADTHQDGWPQLIGDPIRWDDFVRSHAPRQGPEMGPPRGSPPSPPFGPSGDRPPPRGGGPMLERRLVLLDVDGNQIAGSPNRTALFERRPICPENNCAGAQPLGYLGLSAPIGIGTESDAFFLRAQYSSLAFAALIAIVMSAAAAYVIARQLLVPIKRLETGAKRMASGNYTSRIKEGRTDELGQLIGHYNTLAATLDQTAKAEREWISNTSHELQTPLAVLRAQIEALQDGIRQPDEATLIEMHGALMRLSRLVQDLKTLSHAREAELAIERGPEDLSEIVKQAAETAQPKLNAKGIDLELNLPPQVWAGCDRVQIGQVVDNLLENAGRYTDGPGKVRLNLLEADGAVLLTVDDTPPAVPDDDVHRLFDRFYRVESSRSRAYGGSGLGLSICKTIIEAHGGTIAAGRSDMGGLNISIRLPKGAA
jgi:two-component system sensor histidine kinase BaeS